MSLQQEVDTRIIGIALQLIDGKTKRSCSQLATLSIPMVGLDQIPAEELYHAIQSIVKKLATPEKKKSNLVIAKANVDVSKLKL